MLDAFDASDDLDNDRFGLSLRQGAIVCDPDPAPIRCGEGPCRRCNCSNWQPQSMDPNTCLCLHGYGDHGD